jgi:hypothetical protein
MADTYSQEEVRARYIAKMGAELGELQYLLWHDVTWLQLKWVEYRELFAAKSTRIDLMNETAPAFFGRLQDVLWEDVLLHLSRLTDAPVMSGKQNLTVRQYPRLVANLSIRDSVEARLARVMETTKFAQDWRNRFLAHRDLLHAQDPTAKPLESGSRASVQAALAAIRDLMQVLENHFTHNDVGYQDVDSAAGGAWDLLFHLELGLEAKQARDPLDGHWKPKYL